MQISQNRTCTCQGYLRPKLIQATEKIPHLSLRGRVMARGGYTFADMAEMSTEEILFVDHYQTKSQLDLVKAVRVVMNEMIGYEIDSTQLKSTESGGTSDGMVRLPLTVAIAPEFYSGLLSGKKKGKKKKQIKDEFGEAETSSAMVVDGQTPLTMEHISAEEFKKRFLGIKD